MTSLRQDADGRWRVEGDPKAWSHTDMPLGFGETLRQAGLILLGVLVLGGLAGGCFALNDEQGFAQQLAGGLLCACVMAALIVEVGRRTSRTQQAAGHPPIWKPVHDEQGRVWWAMRRTAPTGAVTRTVQLERTHNAALVHLVVAVGVVALVLGAGALGAAGFS